ncbi:ROK family transcriptional regulator [Leeia oryzae]|uniref:ROK family transcriptional regulator n=1 Tax=Leeia oryzae TaxID=356662 RepID=UPI00036A90C0|nr:ROK family transcriptional regulator [Leeia oryzae]
MKKPSLHDQPTPAGTNLEHAKYHNRRVVIETVRLHGTLTRAEIARLTALTAQTVSNIVSELQASGMITAHGPVKVGRGQPATPLTINPDGAYSIGIELDHQSLIGVLVDLAGKLRGRIAMPVSRPTPAVAMPMIVEVVQQLRQQVDIDWERMLGIGLVMPGPFGVENMSSKGPTTLPGWDNFDVETELQQLTSLPVLLENDANAAAIGERLYGVAKSLNNFAYVFIGTGLGAGLFLNGSLYRGQAKNAGEIGHMVVMPEGRACYCGNKGCLERYVSLDAAYEILQIPESEQHSPDILLQNPQAFDEWLKIAVPALRQGINIIESMLDIESIVLGGFLPAPLLERLIAALDPLPVSIRSDYAASNRLRVGVTGTDTAALGAAALPIFDEFNPRYDVLLKAN